MLSLLGRIIRVTGADTGERNRADVVGERHADGEAPVTAHALKGGDLGGVCSGISVSRRRQGRAHGTPDTMGRRRGQATAPMRFSLTSPAAP